jgi:hypothetical protein
MPCVTGISSSDEAQHFERLLCKACRYLTVDQIKSLMNPNSGICDGLDWYSNHLWLDCKHKDGDVLSFYDEEKRQIDLRELNRIGFEIKQLECGSQLIPLKRRVYPY